MAMDVNRDEICKSLMDWFSVLMANDESLKPSNRSDISDGIAMARALHNLGPEFFTGELLLSHRIKSRKSIFIHRRFQIHGCRR